MFKLLISNFHNNNNNVNNNDNDNNNSNNNKLSQKVMNPPSSHIIHTDTGGPGVYIVAYSKGDACSAGGKRSDRLSLKYNIGRINRLY